MNGMPESVTAHPKLGYPPRLQRLPAPTPIIAAFRDLHEPAEAEYRLQKVLNELIGKRMGREEPAAYH